MTRIVALLVLILSISSAQAQEQGDTREDEVRSNPPRKETDSGRKPAAWPQPFQPSQEIGADSQISFPTDI